MGNANSSNEQLLEQLVQNALLTNKLLDQSLAQRAFNTPNIVSQIVEVDPNCPNAQFPTAVQTMPFSTIGLDEWMLGFVCTTATPQAINAGALFMITPLGRVAIMNSGAGVYTLAGGEQPMDYISSGSIRPGAAIGSWNLQGTFIGRIFGNAANFLTNPYKFVLVGNKAPQIV